MSAAESAYRLPPRLISVTRLPTDALALNGLALADSNVRLASPAGAIQLVKADAKGAWKLSLPASDGLRVFGLSMQVEGRTLQSEGYLAITPHGRGVNLRAGSGAEVIGAFGPKPLILAIDFDRRGGTVVSGTARAKSLVAVRADGRLRGQIHSDDNARFSLAFNEPLAGGRHHIEISSNGGHDATDIDISDAQPLAGTAFHAELIDRAWRLNWLTPGGGIQTTLIMPTQANEK